MRVHKTLARKVPLFLELSDSELGVIIKSSRIHEYPRGHILFYEGDPGSSMLVILSGRVKIVLLGKGGREVLLTVLREGDFLGVMALLDGAPRSATAVAQERSVILQVSRDHFLHLIQRHHTMNFKILLQLAKWLRGADEQIRSLSMYDTYGRIVRRLLKLGIDNGGREDGRIVIEPRPSYQELARWIGCSRETVSRAMKVMRENGYITDTKTTLVVEQRALQRYPIKV